MHSTRISRMHADTCHPERQRGISVFEVGYSEPARMNPDFSFILVNPRQSVSDVCHPGSAPMDRALRLRRCHTIVAPHAQPIAACNQPSEGRIVSGAK